MADRSLGPGLRLLIGIVGLSAIGAGLLVCVTELRLAYLGSPRIPTLIAAMVAGMAAVGGGLIVRGAIRGRIAVRDPRGKRHPTDSTTPRT